MAIKPYIHKTIYKSTRKLKYIMYQFFDFVFDRPHLLEIFNCSEKDVSSTSFTKSKIDLLKIEEINNLFDHFSFIPRDIRSVDLVKIEKSVGPYINPYNNGLILFPLTGSLKINFYQYVPYYNNERPTLNPNVKKSKKLLQKIEDSFVEEIKIDKPVAFNGLIPHTYAPIGEFISLILKIPLNYDWEMLNIKGNTYEIL